MTLTRFLSVAAAAVVLLAAGIARADEKISAEKCADLFDQCIVRCQTDHRGDAPRRAPCVAACSGKYAACDAGVAYDRAKPWIEEQAKRTKRFFDDLIEKYGEKPPPPRPRTKNKDNSI